MTYKTVAIIGAGADGQAIASRYLNEARRLPTSIISDVNIWNHKTSGKIEKLKALKEGEATIDDFIDNKEKNQKKDSDVHYDFGQPYAREHSHFFSPQHEGNTSDIISSLSETVANADYVYISVPSQNLREISEFLAKVAKQGVPVISRSKGAEYKHIDDKLIIYTPYQIMKEEFAEKGVPKFIEGGLNFASEVIANIFQYSNISTGIQKRKHEKDYSYRDNLLSQIESELSGRGYPIKRTKYLVTPQLAFIFKNIGAMASGITSGYNLKNPDDPIDYDAISVRLNIVQSFMSNLKPMVCELGGNTTAWAEIPMSITDFLGTSLNEGSRNSQAGKLKALGKTIDQIKSEVKMTIEGLEQLKYVGLIAKARPELDPAGIIRATYDIFYNEANIGEIINKISTLDPKNYVPISKRDFAKLNTFGHLQDRKGKSEPIEILLR